MLDTGNLVMNNSKGIGVWQSFDYPTDTLVPWQRVRTNQTLISRVSTDNVSEGHYILRVEPGGPVLYANFYGKRIPYALVGYDNSISANTTDILNSPCNHTTVIYTVAGVNLEQEGGETPQCQAVSKYSLHGINFATQIGGAGFRYLRLDPDGDIRSYLQSSSSLALDNDLFKGYFGSYCKLPGYCGQNSLCSQVETCNCPSNSFKYIDPLDPRQGCSPLLPLNCSKDVPHHLEQLSAGVDYYANDYIAPKIVRNMDECKNMCLSNCSCVAAFFKNTTNECHLYEQIETIEYGTNPSIIAFLKVVGLEPVNTPNNSIQHMVVAITVSVSAFLLCLLLVVGSIIIRRQLIVARESSEEDAFLETLPGLPPRFSYKELERITEGFSKKLGTGGSGSVYEGVLLDGNVVAVKQLKASELNAGSKQFRAEVATLGNVNHVNLVQLRGFCSEGPHRLLVYEFMPNGSLDTWIFRNRSSLQHDEMIRGSPLPWDVRYLIAVDTARGLAFLHEESRERVVHLDVKPQNILLDKDFHAKLADFGLSKLLDRGQSRTVTAMRGTPGYMAPEWFLNLPITDRSDVFSYGMVLLEIIGGRKNLNLSVATEEWYFPGWAAKQVGKGRLMEVVDKEMQCVEDDNEVKEKMERLIKVALWCIQEDPNARPAMSTVLLMLEEHLEVPHPPLDLPYAFKAHSSAARSSLS